jgi:mannose-6-phosphate isomerase-like protein (cupin superfamily)
MKHYLSDTFSVIKPDQSVETIEVSPTIYQQLDENFNQFKGHQLVSLYEFNEDWNAWEIHPKGDEIVVLLSGEITFILDIDGEHKEVELSKQGEYVIVPKDTWHTAKTNTPTKALFITPGERTGHK